MSVQNTVNSPLLDIPYFNIELEFIFMATSIVSWIAVALVLFSVTRYLPKRPSIFNIEL